MENKTLFEKYELELEALNSLEVSKKDRFKALLFGYLISLIIVFTPVIITCHFLINYYYFDLIFIVVGLLFLLFLIMGEVFNHKLLFSYADKKLEVKTLHKLDFIIYLVFVVITYFLVILLY